MTRIRDNGLVMDLAPRAADEFLNNRHLAVVKFAGHRKRKLKGASPRLIWPAQPSVLPGKRDGLKGSSDPGEFTITVAKLHRLMLRKRDRDRPTYTRIRLKRPDLKDIIDGGFAPVPVVAIDRGPQPRLHVVTQMHFDRAYGGLRQRYFGDWRTRCPSSSCCLR